MNERDLQNKIETVNDKGHKTVYGALVLTADTTFHADYETRNQRAESLVVKAGTRVNYEYRETSAGNYHIVRTWRNERRFEALVVKTERSFTDPIEAPSTPAFDVAKELKPGDIIETGDRTCYPNNTGNRLPEPVLEVRSMKVTHVALKDDIVSVTYVPCDRPNTVLCGFGVFHIAASGPKPYGEQWIRLIGRDESYGKPTSRIWQPRPGDAGYDLMC